MDSDTKKLYESAMTVFGRRGQLGKLKEELEELFYEANTALRDKHLDFNVDNDWRKRFIDELTDVRIMVEQFELLLPDDELKERRLFKLNRLRGYVEEITKASH